MPADTWAVTSLHTAIGGRRAHTGDGSGALLGAAAADVLSAGPARPYGSGIQQNIVVAYHLLRNGTIRPAELGSEFLAMDHREQGPGLYRNEEPWLRAWLAEAEGGSPVALRFENPGAAVRVVPVGVWFRKDPPSLVDGAIRAALVTHSHPGSVVAACALAAAIAAASFGQSGRDLVYGAAEGAGLAEARLKDLPDLSEPKKGSPPLSLLLKHAARMVGTPAQEVATAVRSWTPDAAAVSAVLVAIICGAPLRERPSDLVRETAGIDQEARATSLMAGAIVGARVGLHRWPWPVDNDLWFAELGRRLAAADRRFEDLPDLYAVEEVLAFGHHHAGEISEG